MAQTIKIGGNIYGGGNAGNLSGNTSVTVHSGDLNNVFGGARMANVGGAAFVHVDGEHASSYIVINKVFGGNDIAGTVGENAETKEIPSDILTHKDDLRNTVAERDTNRVDNTWDAIVRISTKTETVGTGANATLKEADDAQKVYIGQLYGGGNGDYTYDTKTTTITGEGDVVTTKTTYVAKTKVGDEWVEVAESDNELKAPVLDKAYLEVVGGSIVYAYGGGNAATVQKNTVICVDNPSKVVNHIYVDADGVEDKTVTEENFESTTGIRDLLDNARFEQMGIYGISLGFTKPSSDEFQIGRFFGGNNKAPMAIMPKWNLLSGKIRNLYGGGNEGHMYASNGLLLEIGENSKIIVDNVFGGCRKADVHPLKGDGSEQDHVYSPEGYAFPPDLASRVIIRGGDVNNVYGGNDISGKVHFGSAVGVYADVRGDIYGGGNGFYAYTDNPALENDKVWGDYYYDVKKILGTEASSWSFGSTAEADMLLSVEALNQFRPNAEQVSIRIAGKSETNPVVIGGSVYVGGNCATLKPKEGYPDPMAELKIGSYLIADKVFLGNNGENMVDASEGGLLATYAGNVVDDKGNTRDFSTLNLTDSEVFKKYMDGVTMDMEPDVVFDNQERDGYPDYKDYSASIGSFYCGGNVGSMRSEGSAFDINFDHKVIIFNKLVGGCNNANVDAHEGLNAAYQGGLIGAAEEETGNKMILNLSGLKIQPKRWVVDRDDNYNIVYRDANNNIVTTPDEGTVTYTPNANGKRQLEWNTVDNSVYDTETKTFKEVPPVTSLPEGATEVDSQDEDTNRRLFGGNIYGGCYNSGIVNGNVVININSTIVDREDDDPSDDKDYGVFDSVIGDTEGESILYESDNYKITKRRSGVILDEQGMDVFGQALNVFGGGHGKDTEIWGSTTINLTRGYTFQIFGGSEEGVIGKSIEDQNRGTSDEYEFNGKHYQYDAKYSCYINVMGENAGVSKQADHTESMAEAEFIYGGGFFGPIAGNTIINLGRGRVFNTFAGSCNADILGHTETYIGRMPKPEYKNTFGQHVNDEATYVEGFPWVRDIVYGGNDLGGKILGHQDFIGRVSDFAKTKMYVPSKPTGSNAEKLPVLTDASAYVEYLQGRADGIFGGCYGTYDYTKPKFKEYFYTTAEATIPEGKSLGDAKPGNSKPYINNAFVNFRPSYVQTTNVEKLVKKVYGAGQGQSGEKARDILQNRSYVLIDIPEEMETKPYYQAMEVFGAGAWGGVGMSFAPTDAKANPDSASAVIDLMRGNILAAYGGSYKEGITRRTVVNVPSGSTINISNIFGGGYGYVEEQEDNSGNITLVAHNEVPCDVYEANVNFSSDDAFVTGDIYGGNNACRRTIFGRVNINSTVHSSPSNLSFQGNVYGAGKGKDSWSHYTEVNLNRNAKVYYVYGGGNAGKVLNDASFHVWKDTPGNDIYYNMGAYNIDNAAHSAYMYPSSTNPMISPAEYDGEYYNTNVHVKEGATITGYGFGGGYGADAVVSGTAYFDILGGTAEKDISGSGRSGDVKNLYEKKGSESFTAKTMVYVRGGTARNVYGSGWRGSVGRHNGEISDIKTGDDSESATDYTTYNDIDGVANVVIGKANGTSYIDGIPAITRNVYGGGEGGSVFGTANITINNGFIGYRYEGTDPTTFDVSDYKEELLDGDQSLEKGGNVFGGGYVANSYVDRSDIKMYDGLVRGSIFGGGEIGPIGRGTVKEGAPSPTGTFINGDAKIYKGGETHVYLYGGQVTRNVFGGGRGYDNWGGNGTKFMEAEEIEAADLVSKGFVFGHTNVHIRGGEVGTADNALRGFGNVFGGGDEGFVYSSLGKKLGTPVSDDDLTNGMPAGGGGFYYNNGAIANGMSLCSNVVVEPYCRVTTGTITFDDYVKDANGKIECDYEGDDPSGLPKKNGSTITFNTGEYVPVEYLLQLRNKSADTEKWGKLDATGVTIHNAVFAGGNITEGSDIVYANTTTVFGNAAASLRDVYNRDLISVGTDDLGGIYGDGNLTLVDGFRELHIDNYGTDFYSLSDKVEYDIYESMTEREKAYYQLRYVAKISHDYEYYVSESLHTYNGTPYKKGQKVTEATWKTFDADEQALWKPGKKVYQENDQIEDSEWALMDPVEQANWQQDGVFSKYAGRPLNTIQRADMCGVYGSRLVLKGAQDRASEEVDYNSYTINRVDEVSLNQRRSLAGDTGDDALHGNYFGIYNSVKFLGNLTSDVFFNVDQDIRRTDVADGGMTPDATYNTYYKWKEHNPTSKYRNNGISYNKVALASGVYLEIKREEGEKTNTDDWGYITGVVELDLINVMQGMGGGYVYAKNQHGAKTWNNNWGKVTALDYNLDARTYRQFSYNQNSLQQIETSGNFVHNTKQIVDDCYPNSGMYTDGYVSSPAHYWYIRGSIYVYEQYISAYTGVANAYAEKVELPLTITAASNGRMTLREVQPNYYAYYDKNGMKLGESNHDEKLIVNNNTYYLNDPISYWEYRLLSDADKEKFVKETYTTIAECTIGNTTYPAGFTMLPGAASQAGTYEAIKASAPTGKLKDTDPDGSEVKYVLDADGNKVAFDFVFRQSNNLSHDTGYILTYDVNNPTVWNDYYTKTVDHTVKINTNQYEGKEALPSGTTLADYTDAPTYTPRAGMGGVYGQRPYSVGEVINANVYNSYTTNIPESVRNGDGQAKMEQAYIVTSEISIMDGTQEVQRLYPGVAISRNAKYTNASGTQVNYTADQWAAITAKAEPAKVCTKLLQFSASDYVFAGQLLSSADIAELKSKVKTTFGKTDEQAETFLNDYMTTAYYCYDAGLYGGKNFVAGQAYSALDTWCDLPKADREKFNFNYDAFDVLIDPTYSNRDENNYGEPKVQYDGYKFGTTNTPLHTGDTPLDPKVYSVTKPVDYQAEFKGYQVEGSVDPVTTFTYTDENGTTHTITANESPSGWLTREAYEDIPNERHHYSPITVSEPGDYHVVKSVFMRGDVPYTVGQVIDESTYESLNDQQKRNIDTYTFVADDIKKDNEGHYVNTNYYYCREDYTVNEKGEGVAVTPKGSTTPINANSVVPKGTLIDETNYNNLKNKQQGFVIHGTSPTEVSTLYVSSESDIYDLSKEKIITVIYLYEYEESDESGLNVTPVSERHIVNIHIKFESGVPEVGELHKPDIVLPGTSFILDVPTVTEGAYRVTGSGWELFYKQSDAATHTNGIPYQNNITPVYWYQNNYWLAYYAQTYLGKTYSNAVQVNVANYHDLKNVMADKEHHYYIDHKDVDYEPKIYINDYKTDDPATSQNGLDLLKNLYDLSLLDEDDVSTDSETGLISEGTFVGHGLLNERVEAGQDLEFFFRADLDGSSASASTTGYDAVIAGKPIGSTTESTCFAGTVHGDGHYVSGLDKSLFGNLCGDVYNLGATGTFTGAGIAETGSGYVENCWVATSSTAAKTSMPVFGNPTGLTTERPYRIVNCYYQEEDEGVTNSYTNHSGTYGIPTKKPKQAFFNGEVAYDLNGFYLLKRYTDGTNQTTGLEHKYFTIDALSDPTTKTPSTAHYGTPDASLSSSGVADVYLRNGYVEDRFRDGDFRYAGGSIPTTADERAYNYLEGTVTKTDFYPIWPDDYIFFGQNLSYGHVEGHEHQDVPSSIVRTDGRVETSSDGNRVYRAPAYFRSKNMEMAHFNPDAVFAQTKKGDANTIAYKNMTAIDFTGGNGDVAGGFKKGDQAGHFYPPLLDDDGLTGFRNVDLTRNLLAYTSKAPAEGVSATTAALKTAKVVGDYLGDAVYSETNETYRTVPVFDRWSDILYGHWVQLIDGAYEATNDHLLLDRNDFNAPISYQFTGNHRMWYQRKPDSYVDRKMGWEAVSLPFSAEVVTTQTKGEITHFFGSTKEIENSKNGTGSKLGHEYWLREIDSNSQIAQKKENNVDVTGVLTVDFNYPSKTAGSNAPDYANAPDVPSGPDFLGEKDVTNTFLWDYYYNAASGHKQKDLNKDTYQTYYEDTRQLEDYPLLTRGRPYIIGFPGKTYYEFDLSGTFRPSTTLSPNPGKLDPQVITFASVENAIIHVSDNETAGVEKTFNGVKYTFKPSYLNMSFDAGTDYYTLKAEYDSNNDNKPDCSSFVKVPAAPAEPVAVDAFRPYFMSVATSSGGSGTARPVTRSIVFSQGDEELEPREPGETQNANEPGTINVYAKKHKVVVESMLNYATDVRIVNTAGQTIDSFTLKPGETVETRVNHAAVYIVQTADGQYTKKLAVK